MAFNLKQINWKITLLGVVLGAIGGYAYYYFIGCRSGSCPITSDPLKMTLYGSVFGAVLFFKTKKQDA